MAILHKRIREENIKHIGYIIDRTGFIACNDTLSCVQWCAFARKGVGDEMYEHMMEMAAAQKLRV